MENDGSLAIAIIGYIIALISPIIGLLYGAYLVFFKKESALYQKHGRFIIYFAIVVFIVSYAIRMMI